MWHKSVSRRGGIANNNKILQIWALQFPGNDFQHVAYNYTHTILLWYIFYFLFLSIFSCLSLISVEQEAIVFCLFFNFIFIVEKSFLQ